MVTPRKYTEEILTDAVRASTSVAGVLRHLGVRPRGGAHAHISCDGTWLGMPLTLEVDHIDGDYCNNLIDNLRFLCPNCHRQTPDFAGRSKGKFSGHVAALKAMSTDS